MRDPADYVGREQTFLKHRVLEEYLNAWSQKLASLARGGQVRLWYVDCFAGPWSAVDENRSDTSIAIGLSALNSALRTWKAKGLSVAASAIFVEKDARAFDALKAFVQQHAGAVDAHPLHGEFGDHVDAIRRHVGRDPAFLFVDPKGWKGAAMQFIAPLARGHHRDVLVNVMLHHIQRFKDDPRAFLRAQMRDFFGIEEGELPARLSEEQLMAVYRDHLKRASGLRYVADLLVLQPTKEQTKFRLVVGGSHSAVLELFRQVERRVIGRDAPAIRDAAKKRARGVEGQGTLFGQEHALEDWRYEAMKQEGLRSLRRELPDMLSAGPRRFEELWPAILERFHLTKKDVGDVLGELRTEGFLCVQGMKPRERRIKDEHVVGLAKGAGRAPNSK